MSVLLLQRVRRLALSRTNEPADFQSGSAGVGPTKARSLGARLHRTAGRARLCSHPWSFVHMDSPLFPLTLGRRAHGQPRLWSYAWSFVHRQSFAPGVHRPCPPRAGAECSEMLFSPAAADLFSPVASLSRALRCGSLI